MNLCQIVLNLSPISFLSLFHETGFNDIIKKIINCILRKPLRQKGRHMPYSVNNAAWDIVQDAILPHQQELNVRAHTLQNGALVIDMGIHEKGGFEAGRLFTLACMGGIGELRFTTLSVGSHLVPVASITVDKPVITELAAHDAFLYIPYKDGRHSVSGPMRAIRCLDPFVQAAHFCDTQAKHAVACTQIDEMPDETFTDYIAEAAGMSADKLVLLAASTACMTGSVQVCARNVEQVIPSLLDQGFPIDTILQANGTAPFVACLADENLAMGRVNDGLIYGQETNLYVDCEDSEIEKMYDILPFSKNKDVYGIPFETLFARCDNTWVNVPREWDAPCKVNFFNLRTNHRYEIGQISYSVLEHSFLGSSEQNKEV